MQMQIQALLATGAGEGEWVMEESNTESNIKVAKPLVFNEKVGKVEGFIIVYKLYLRMRMREVSVEKQI